jgi:hypothetical protein
VAKKDTYSIHYQRQKLLDQFRGDRIFGDEYAVIKYDQLGVEGGIYHVVCSTLGDMCDCPAGQRETCRHREMVYIFKDAGMMDRETARYNYDTKQWASQ